MEPTQVAQLTGLIIWPYLIIFVLLAYVIKKAFGNLLQRITPWEWKPVYTVLIIATIVGIFYGVTMDVKWMPLVLTYCIGTSFHELILDKIIKGFTALANKIFGG